MLAALLWIGTALCLHATSTRTVVELEESARASCLAKIVGAVRRLAIGQFLFLQRRRFEWQCLACRHQHLGWNTDMGIRSKIWYFRSPWNGHGHGWATTSAAILKLHYSASTTVACRQYTRGRCRQCYERLWTDWPLLASATGGIVPANRTTSACGGTDALRTTVDIMIARSQFVLQCLNK